MSYFKVFPKTLYRVDDVGTQRVVTDILKRFSFKNNIKNNGDLFAKYRLKDGETLQTIATKLYGSPDTYWILLMMNNIVDPYDDLHKDQQELTNYIAQKYPGNCLFLNLSATSTNLKAFEGDFVVGETVYAASNQIVDGEEILTNVGYTATVLEWDGNLRKLVVSLESNVNSLTDNIRIVGTTSNARGSFKRRVSNIVAVHHFEDSFGNEINPLPSPLSDDQSSPLDAYLDQTELVDISVINNTEYEENINNEKRIIKVLRVEYATQIMQDIQRVFNR